MNFFFFVKKDGNVHKIKMMKEKTRNKKLNLRQMALISSFITINPFYKLSFTLLSALLWNEFLIYNQVLRKKHLIFNI